MNASSDICDAVVNVVSRPPCTLTLTVLECFPVVSNAVGIILSYFAGEETQPAMRTANIQRSNNSNEDNLHGKYFWVRRFIVSLLW